MRLDLCRLRGARFVCNAREWGGGRNLSATKTERLVLPQTLYFVRHAQAAHDPEDPDPALSELGFRQAVQTAARLAREPFDYCYVSSMRRARQTADKILEGRQDVKRVITDDIQEVSRFHFCPVSAETLAHFRTMMETESDTLARFSNRIRHEHKPGERILLVCHGNVIRTLIPMLCNRKPAESVMFEMHNASVSIVDIFPSGVGVVRLVNSVEHLAPEAVTVGATHEPSAIEPGLPGL